MFSILYILLFAAGGYMIFGEKVFGAIIGAVLGFAYTVFLGAMPPIITFVIIGLGLLVGGLRVYGDRSSDGV